jgi:hypothetical protein
MLLQQQQQQASFFVSFSFLLLVFPSLSLSGFVSLFDSQCASHLSKAPSAPI